MFQFLTALVWSWLIYVQMRMYNHFKRDTKWKLSCLHAQFTLIRVFGSTLFSIFFSVLLKRRIPKKVNRFRIICDGISNRFLLDFFLVVVVPWNDRCAWLVFFYSAMCKVRLTVIFPNLKKNEYKRLVFGVWRGVTLTWW